MSNFYILRVRDGEAGVLGEFSCSSWRLAVKLQGKQLCPWFWTCLSVSVCLSLPACLSVCPVSVPSNSKIWNYEGPAHRKACLLQVVRPVSYWGICGGREKAKLLDKMAAFVELTCFCHQCFGMVYRDWYNPKISQMCWLHLWSEHHKPKSNRSFQLSFVFKC